MLEVSSPSTAITLQQRRQLYWQDWLLEWPTSTFIPPPFRVEKFEGSLPSSRVPSPGPDCPALFWLAAACWLGGDDDERLPEAGPSEIAATRSQHFSVALQQSVASTRSGLI